MVWFTAYLNTVRPQTIQERVKDNKWIIPTVLIGGLVVTGTTIFLLTRKSKEFKYDDSLSGPEKIKAWINWMTPNAKRIGKRYGLPWQALVAQTGWETGWGKSSLSSKYYNFAGMKAKLDKNGKPIEPAVKLRTHEYRNGVKVYEDAWFKKFRSLDEGLKNYALFFHNNSRYATALKYPNDPYKFITEIRKAGYATSPTYVSDLHGILNKYLSKG